MRAGRLRHRITIEVNTPTRSARGEAIPSWSAFASNRAAGVEPLSARESTFAKSYAATASHVVELRYLAGVLPTMRVVFGSRVLAINGVLDVGNRRRELKLFCTEIV